MVSWSEMLSQMAIVAVPFTVLASLFFSTSSGPLSRSSWCVVPICRPIQSSADLWEPFVREEWSASDKVNHDHTVLSNKVNEPLQLKDRSAFIHSPFLLSFVRARAPPLAMFAPFNGLCSPFWPPQWPFSLKSVDLIKQKIVWTLSLHWMLLLAQQWHLAKLAKG